MLPVEFPEQNCVYTREDCLNLPAYQMHNNEFNALEIISCWEFTDEELVQIVKDFKAGIKPRIHLSVIGGQPPVALYVREDEHN